MKKIFVPTGIAAGLLMIAAVVWGTPETPRPRVRLETTLGTLVVVLHPEKAPKTVDNFMKYVESGFYDGTLFHRVIRGFMVQGGGLTPDMQRKPAMDPIVNEADNGLLNRRGTIAMARTQAPHSATAQFFINTVDNPFLDHKEKTDRGWGYCVFGEVVSGLPVLDRIEGVHTTNRSGHRDVPAEPVILTKAVVENGETAIQASPDASGSSRTP